MAKDKKHHSTIVINGRTYSALTGEELSPPEAAASPKRTVDGVITPFTEGGIRPRTSGPPQKVARHPQPKNNQPQSVEVVNKTPKAKSHANAVHGRVRVNDALKRERAVAVDANNTSSAIKPRASVGRSSAGASSSEPKGLQLTRSQIEERTKRAAAHQKSQQIAKFTPNYRQGQSAGVPIGPALQHEVPPLAKAPVSTPRSTSFNNQFHIPPAKMPRTQFQPEPVPVPADETTKPKFSFNPFRQLQFAPALASVLSILVVTGYVTYLNIPGISLRVAASRADVDANMPAYHPDGFSFDGPINWHSGQVAIDFKSNTDNRGYTILQRSSNKDSQSLLQEEIVAEGHDYSTYQKNGLTIYVYGNSQAAWVNGGVWYSIEGDSLLNPEQLVNIASSL